METQALLTPGSPESITANALRDAYRALSDARIDECLAALSGLGQTRGDPLFDVLKSAALAVRDGDWTDYVKSERGFPCLAGVLYPAAQSFLRRGEGFAAYECLSQLECLRPGSWGALRGLADKGFHRRYAAWDRSDSAALTETFREWGDDSAAFMSWSLQALYVRLPDGVKGSPLQRTYIALQEGRWRDAELLLREQGVDSPVHATLALLVDADSRLARDDRSGAATSIIRACTLGVSVPWLHLQCCRVLSWSQHPEFMYEALTLLELVDSGAPMPYFWAVPFDAQVRYAGTLLFRMLRTKSPHIYSLQRAKREMVARWGPVGTAMMHAELFWQGKPWDWSVRHLVGVQSHAATEPSLKTHTFSEPTSVRMLAPQVFGKSRRADIVGISRRFSVTFLPNCLIACKSNLAFSEGVALMDAQDEERAKIPYNPDVNPPVICFFGDRLLVITLASPTHRAGKAMGLVGNHTENFGHWFIEFIFQAIACAQLPGFEDVAVAIDAQMPRQHRELLEMVLPPRHPIVELGPGESLECEELWSCSKAVYMPGGETFPIQNLHQFQLCDAGMVAGLIHKLDERLQISTRPALPTRLYLTRRVGQSPRQLQDREAVEAWFAANGFEVVDFASVSMADQLRYVRGARTIVLEGGSARYPAMFAAPGTRIGELSDDWWAEHEWHATMFDALGLEYAIFLCPRNQSRKITVDTSRLGAFIESLEGGAMKDKQPLPELYAIKAELTRAVAEIARLRNTCDGLTTQVTRLSSEVQLARTAVDVTRSKMDVGAEWLHAFWQYRTSEAYERVYMEAHPLVSVCMTTYNRAELLVERALASVLNQDYPNLEVIVVGDGCTDSTEERMKAVRDPRVRFINRPRTRELPIDSLARWKVAGTDPANLALELAKGDLITHLDDDDEYLPGRISKLVEHLQTTRSEFLFHPFYAQPQIGPWTINSADTFQHGAVTTGSVLGLAWFKRIPWNLVAFVYDEPDDWNRFRRIKYLGARIARHPDVLLRHYVERKPEHNRSYEQPHPDELNLSNVVIEGFVIPPYSIEGLWPDAWAGEELSVTVVPPHGSMSIEFSIETPEQFAAGLHLQITNGEHQTNVELPPASIKSVVLPLHARSHEPVRIQVRSLSTWCPMETVGATDNRHLAFRLLGLKLVNGPIPEPS